MNDRLTKRLLIDRYKANEYAVYLIGWILLFCIPLITQFYSGGSIRYDRLVRGWVHLLPFLAVFFINDSILMPFLFLKGKKTIYLSIVACILLTVWFGINPPPRPTAAGTTRRNVSRDQCGYGRLCNSGQSGNKDVFHLPPQGYGDS